MAGNFHRWISGGMAAALGLVLAFLAGQDGERPIQPHADPPAVPEPVPQGTDGPEKWSESLGAILGRAFRTAGDQAAALRERVEGFIGIYKLLRALGMSDQQIASLIAEQASQVLGRELSEHAPTAADTRRVLDAVQETVIRAAQEVDVRLDLGGEFAHRAREGVQATRAGREDALTAVEKTVGTAKELLGKILSKKEE